MLCKRTPRLISMPYGVSAQQVFKGYTNPSDGFGSSPYCRDDLTVLLCRPGKRCEHTSSEHLPKKR